MVAMNVSVLALGLGINWKTFTAKTEDGGIIEWEMMAIQTDNDDGTAVFDVPFQLHGMASTCMEQ